MAARRNGCAMAALALLTAGAGPLTPASTVDDVLDAMQARVDLRSFTADVSQTLKDTTHGYDTTFAGKAWFQIPAGGEARLRVAFDTKQKGKKPPVPNRKEYLLEGGWLTDRDFSLKNETKRQVVRPGDKLNLFELGKGPFPLPIGQSKAEVRKQFTVAQVPPAKGDPANTIHLALTPKPDSTFARQFSYVDFWVDVSQQMPVRIETVDAHGVNDQVTDLTNLKVNPPLTAAAFALQPVTGWKLDTIPYGE